jgi:hypothetical protein
MITLRKYEPEDWSKIDDAIEPFMPIALRDGANERGLVVTAVEDGRIMACGGIAYVNNEQGVVWVKVSKECLMRPYRWARTIRETFRLMKESVDDLRISTYVLSDFCKGEKLAKLIGMKRTNKTEEYNGNTYNKYMVI